MSNLAFPPEWLPNYNVKDYQRWEGDWELIRGFPFAMSPALKRRHQYVGGQFVTAFNNDIKRNAGIATAKFCTKQIGWLMITQSFAPM